MSADTSSTNSVELDLTDFSKEQLVYIIQQSANQDISVNRVIEQLIVQFLDAHDESKINIIHDTE